MLRVLAASEDGLSATEIEARLDIPRTTAFRILKTLRHEGMVDKHGTSFRPAAGLFEIGLHALSRSHLRERAVPLLQALTAATGQTSHLAVPSGWYSLILEVCDSAGPVRVASRPGTLAELNCSATGKLFLSYIHRERIGEYLAAAAPQKRTPNTLCQQAEIMAMTEQVRLQRYATDEEEYHPGVRCLAAPVFDMKGNVVAAIGVTGPAASFTTGRLPEVRDRVCMAAQQLSASLGSKQADVVR
jgi:DNA-binding IclR family transcriptional regulator